jgi:hypothetical protein
MSEKSWDDVKRRLDKEIEAFAKSDITPMADPQPLTANAAPALVLPAAKATVPPAQVLSAIPPAELTQSSIQGGLLSRLKQQAAEKLADGERSASLQATRTRQVSEALRETYIYLRDLCEQLNVIAPAWPNSFQVNESLTFSNLRWSQGRADYRKQPGPTDDRPFERVSLRFRLSATKDIIVERENPVMEKLRLQLIDSNIEFHLDEYRNAKGYTESGRFTIQPALNAGLLFLGDYDSGNISLKVLNLPRLGSAEYLIPAEQLTPEALEEIALLVVGESPRFFKNFERLY